MSKVIRLSLLLSGAVVLAFAGLVSVALGISNSQASKSRLAKMTIRVVGDRDRNGGTYSPKLTILLCNHSDDSVWIRNDLWRAEPWKWHPLQASISDTETGEAASTKGFPRHVTSALRESNFVEVQLRSCYGPMMDLRKRFILKAGKKYKVQFTYSSLAPARVGKIKPWQGKITSETVVIEVPKK